MAIGNWHWGSFLIVVVVGAVIARFSYERGPGADEPCASATSSTADSPEFRPHVRSLTRGQTTPSPSARADSVRSAIRVGMEQVRDEEQAARDERERRVCEIKADVYTVAFWISVGFLVLVTWRYLGGRG
jgi:hypothetical protein